MCAFLYTGSAAMHSDKLLVFEPEGSKLRKAGAGAYGNSLIAIKRRCAARWVLGGRGRWARALLVLAGHRALCRRRRPPSQPPPGQQYSSSPAHHTPHTPRTRPPGTTTW
jgi:hypothetical protein